MINLPKLEEEVLKKWREIKAHEKSVSQRPKSKNFVFYEGPPTANGQPGFHHVESRSFKDVVCRYKAMRGYRVERRAGWDTHGLPVEIQVEKELGLNNKKEIEEYGIAKFNKKCKQSVWRYKQEWERLTERMGFWLDMDDPYITYDPLYMESLWWIIKQAYDKDLLYEGHKVVPFCTRCGTPLSSHEVAQGYKDVTDSSIYAKFKIKEPGKLPKLKDSGDVFILAWTTTPWTLPGNVALAVGKDIEYSIVKQGNERYILATDRLEVLEGEYEVLGSVTGDALVGLDYEPLFDSLKDAEGKKHVVLEADFVTTEDGTGVVHTAVMYGEDDYNLGAKEGLPAVHTVDENGKFNELVPEFEGQFVKKAESAILERLEAENKTYKVVPYKHSYPFCWRCSTPLLYYAMDSWFIRMSGLRKELLEANEKINWVPDHIKQGRFGEWLKEAKDWAFSRSRYWGTPLPAWKCDSCEHVRVIGSRKEIAESTAGRNEYFFLRHGMAEHIEQNKLSTKYPDENKFHITKEGEEQVEKAAGELKKKGVDVIVASPMTRTKETAEIVGKELGVEVVYDEDFLELNVGDYEGKSTESFDKEYDKIESFTKRPPGGGESLADARLRMLKAVKKLDKKYEGKKIAIVSHGHPLWLLETALQGLTVKESFEWREKEYPQVGKVKAVKYTEFPYNSDGELDFHRPHVDKIVFNCPECEGGKMKRVEDLVDVWFDSGSMPFAQQHYPFENKDNIDKGKAYPAEYISEAIDQTRGWFYTMLSVSVLLGKAPSYRNVISLGHVLDEKGQKMSKSKGNTVNPWEMADQYGMDTLRWYFFTVNQPGDNKRFIEKDVKERRQKFVGTFLNSYVFLSTYVPGVKAPKRYSASSSENILDKWIFARLKDTAQKATKAMDEYDILSAARAMDSFVMDDLSNWYIRRSRARLQRPESKKEEEEATKTLAFVLNELAKMSAPYIPFLSEHIWQELNTNTKSVHWEDFPEFSKLSASEEKLLSDMENIREWAQYGLRLRAENSLKVRQPLQAFAVPGKLSKELKEVLKEELNVKEIADASELNSVEGEWKEFEFPGGKVAINISISGDLFVEGRVREMVRHIQDMRKSTNLKPEDKISVYYTMPPELQGKLQEWEQSISQDTNAKAIQEKDLEGVAHDARSDFDWDGQHSVSVAIKHH